MKYYELQKLYIEDGITKENLKILLEGNKDVLEYYFIQHDEYIDFSTGELRKAHIHCYIGYTDYDRKTLKIVKDYFKDITKNIMFVHSIISAIRYSIHLGYNDKIQYKKEDIITNNIDLVNKAIKDRKENINCILSLYIDKLLNNEIILDTESMKFFRDNGYLSYYVSHYTYLKKLKEDLRNELEFDNSLMQEIEFKNACIKKERSDYKC